MNDEKGAGKTHMEWRHRRSDEPGCPSNPAGARFVNMPWSARELVPQSRGCGHRYASCKNAGFSARGPMTREGEQVFVRFNLIEESSTWG